jgi:hypothetical protein
VNTKDRIDEYLAKAKEAEEHASKVKDPDTRQAWLVVAGGYRDLARREGYTGQ